MNRKELWLVVGVSVTSSLATLGLVMALWGGPIALAKDNPTPQKEVRAQNFVLVDKDGKERAILGAATDGGPGLALIDTDWKPRAVLGMKADGNPHFGLSDKEGKYRVLLTVTAGGEPSLNLFDGNRSRAVLGHIDLESTRTGTVERRFASSLVLFDKEGNILWKAP